MAGTKDFTAVEDFFSSETKSQYCAGLSYTMRDEDKFSLVDKWVEDGLVVLGRPPVAQVKGG